MNVPSDLSTADLLRLSPSPSVRRFGEAIVRSASDRPIIDVACGGGRNGALIAHLGGNVIGIDIDLRRLRTEQSLPGEAILRQAFRRIKPLELDLIGDNWPFLKSSVGGIVNIHFLHPPLLERFCDSLIPGGILILETVQARGGNYLELPQAGQIRASLENSFDFDIYREKATGPPSANVAAVQLVARRK